MGVAQLKTGLEVLLEKQTERIQGKRVGIILHPSSINSQFQHALHLLASHNDVQLTAVFGPQHGVRGETQDNMVEWQDYQDTTTHLPTYSLYGKTRSPTKKMLSEIDVLLFDIQDIGSRYYTYIWTMALAMKACKTEDKTFIVLDRPNPINGIDVEGNVLHPNFSSFVGIYPIAVRHGMTTGELALYFNKHFDINCKLEVVTMEGWERQMFFEDTGLPWVLPSPNMPTVRTAMVYPGMCLLEGTNISEGRGTTRPFELSGAPWIDPYIMVKQLNRMNLPGVFFRPTYFTPTFHKWSQQMVGGVQIHVLDRQIFRPFLTGLSLTQLYRELGKDQFQWKAPPYEYEYEKLPFDILCGTNQIRQQIESGKNPREIEQTWSFDLKKFKQTRKDYLLY